MTSHAISKALMLKAGAVICALCIVLAAMHIWQEQGSGVEKAAAAAPRDVPSSFPGARRENLPILW